MTTRRLIFILAGAVLIMAGLSSRKYGAVLPEFFRAYAPDALWAALLYCILVVLRPHAPPVRIAGIALLISFAVEISQLYHAPWIDAVRRTRLGGLILGFGFLWSDLGCYIVGATLPFLVDRVSKREAGAEEAAIPSTRTGFRFRR